MPVLVWQQASRGCGVIPEGGFGGSSVLLRPLGDAFEFEFQASGVINNLLISIKTEGGLAQRESFSRE